MQITVVLASGEARTLEVGERGLLIGSAPDCDFVLQDPGISARHAFFKTDASGAPIVQDMGSDGGTFVNGTRIAAVTALKAGDEVRVGGAAFTLAVPAPAPPVVPVAAVPVAATVPVATADAGAPPPAPRAPRQGSLLQNPVIVAVGAVAALLVIIVIVLLATGGSEEVPSPPPVVAQPVSPLVPSPPSSPLFESPTATQTKPLPTTQARVDGFYDGPKYDITFKSRCSSGSCGGVAQSGAQFQIPYTGTGGNYRGRSTIRATCAKGGVHVQAPFKVDISFHPIAGELIGDETVATKVAVTLRISRDPIQKKVRTSPTVTTTLTCPGFNKTTSFTAVLAA